MTFRVGLFGFGHAVKVVFLGSKETRLKKVIRHGYKMKNYWVPEFLEIELEAAELTGKPETEQERNGKFEQNP